MGGGGGKGVVCVYVWLEYDPPEGILGQTAWVHFHQTYSNYRHELNHTKQAWAGAQYVAPDPDPPGPDPQPNAQQRILSAKETSRLDFLEPHTCRYVFLSLSLYLRPRTARRKKTGCDDSGLSSLLERWPPHITFCHNQYKSNQISPCVKVKPSGWNPQ